MVDLLTKCRVMERKFETQMDGVKFHLKHIGGLTQKEATEYYGCRRLSSKIHRLRHELGWKIKTTEMKVQTGTRMVSRGTSVVAKYELNK